MHHDNDMILCLLDIQLDAVSLIVDRRLKGGKCIFRCIVAVTAMRGNGWCGKQDILGPEDACIL